MYKDIIDVLNRYRNEIMESNDASYLLELEYDLKQYLITNPNILTNLIKLKLSLAMEILDLINTLSTAQKELDDLDSLVYFCQTGKFK